MKFLIVSFIFLTTFVFLPAEDQVPYSVNPSEIFLLNHNGKLFNKSSELEEPDIGEIGKYYAGNITDNNLNTAWVEGVPGDGIGEYVFIASKTIPKTINIYSGYNKNISLFKKNNRPGKLKVSLYFGMASSWGGQFGDYYKIIQFKEDFILKLEDSIHLQTFKFPFNNYEELSTFKTKGLEFLKQVERKKDVPPFPNSPDTKWIIKL